MGYICVCINTHTQDYYSAIKKKEVLPLVTTWTDFGVIMPSKISQREKDKYCMILLTCRTLKKKKKNPMHAVKVFSM